MELRAFALPAERDWLIFRRDAVRVADYQNFQRDLDAQFSRRRDHDRLAKGFLHTMAEQLEALGQQAPSDSNTDPHSAGR